ncbi:Cysteine dioxygenase [Erysiphe neolycopersici]|uniref:Cysteine dioxygenase n=1 Tax=Erysiphe neolycopersici TaxID=212602 RepID=A0A420HJL5_9PEZI|nr:Cysteine dioxygenase [Erysiphe neolycopersici]
MASLQGKILAGNTFGFPEKICNSGNDLASRACEMSFTDTSCHSGNFISFKSDSNSATSHTTKLCSNRSVSNHSQELDFDGLQQAITAVLQMNVQSPLSELSSLLEAYSSNPEHWKIFAHAEPSKQYTRNLIYEAPGVFNLLLLVWNPERASPVHDHADSHCLMKILKGSLREERYSFPTESGPLVKISESTFDLNQVAYISDELGLHRISNQSNTDYAVSLHLYFPPNAALRGCHVYDLKNGGARHVIQDSYDSVHGDVMTKR